VTQNKNKSLNPGIISNTINLLSFSAVTFIINYSVIIYLARVLGTEAFGQLNFAIAITSYFSIFIGFGFSVYGTRELAADSGQLVPLLSSIVMWRLVLFALSLFCISLLTYLAQQLHAIRELLLLFSITLMVNIFITDWVFQGFQVMRPIGISRLLTALVIAGLTVFLITGRDDLLRVPVLQFVGGMVAVLYLYWRLRRMGVSRFYKKMTWESCSRVFLRSAPLAVSVMLIQCIYYIDILMLGLMRAESEVGIYSAAYRLILPVIFVGSIFFDALFPALVVAYKESESALHRLQVCATRIVAMAAAPVAVFGWYFSGAVVIPIYGTEYSAAGTIMPVLMLVPAIIYLNMVYARAMWACEMYTAYNIVLSAQVLINIIANLLLIPTFGILGAAISTVVAEGAGLLGYSIAYTRQRLRIPILFYLWKPFLVSIIVAIAILWWDNSSGQWWPMIAGVLLYATLLWLTGIFKQKDFEFLTEQNQAGGEHGSQSI